MEFSFNTPVGGKQNVHCCSQVSTPATASGSLVMAPAAVVAGKAEQRRSCSSKIKACSHDLADWLVSDG